MQTCIRYKAGMNALRNRRKELGLTLAQLAAKVGVSEGQLSRIERGGKPSLSSAIAIERETGVSVATLVAAAEDRSAA